MKVSIWQQFSSNNSTDYMVVGEFQRASQAKAARELLITMLKDIAEWHRSQNTETTIDPRVFNELTPIELVYQQRLGSTWEEGINWIPRYETVIEEYIEQVDNILIAQTMSHTLMRTPTKPIEGIIELFNGIPHLVASWSPLYKASVTIETNTEQDAGKLSRMVTDGRFYLSESDYIWTTITRKRRNLTFTTTSFWGLAEFIKYLKTYKPKHLSYLFEPLDKKQ
jgi:hypothetical protein